MVHLLDGLLACVQVPASTLEEGKYSLDVCRSLVQYNYLLSINAP